MVILNVKHSLSIKYSSQLIEMEPAPCLVFHSVNIVVYSVSVGIQLVWHKHSTSTLPKHKLFLFSVYKLRLYFFANPPFKMVSIQPLINNI